MAKLSNNAVSNIYNSSKQLVARMHDTSINRYDGTLADYTRYRQQKEEQERLQAEYQQYKQQQAVQDIASPDVTQDSMAEYAQYKNTTGAQLADYDLISNEVKDRVNDLNQARRYGLASGGLIRKTDDGSGLFGYTLDPMWKADDIEKDLEENYGVDDTTVRAINKTAAVANKRDKVNADKGEGYYENQLQEKASKNWTRTYPEEIEYATSRFSDATTDTAALRAEIENYNSQKQIGDKANSTNTVAGMGSVNYALNGGNTAVEKLKQQIMQTYDLTDDEFEDLAYYGGELDDYDRRLEQQEEAKANVNTGSTAGDIKGGIKNSALALAANPLAGIVGAGTTIGYKLGLDGRRDKHSALNVNGDGFLLSNAVSDYQSATQERIGDSSRADEATEVAKAKFQEAREASHDADALYEDIANYNSRHIDDSEKSMVAGINAAMGMDSVGYSAMNDIDAGTDKLKQQIMEKYGLTDDEFEELAGYGKSVYKEYFKTKFAEMAYAAGMSSAESAEVGLLAPVGAGAAAEIAANLGASAKGVATAAKVGRSVAGLTPFGANAFTSSLSENVSSGAEMNDAMTDAMISAGIEVGTELMPFDNFWEIAQSNSRVARNVLASFITQAGIEGLEEVSGDVLDLIIDEIRNGDQSDFNQSIQNYMDNGYSEEEATSLARRDFVLQCIEDFTVGAMSGAMGGAGATAISVYNTSQNANEMFRDFTQQDYVDFAEGINTDEETYVNKSAAQSAQEAKALAEKYAQQETVTDKEKRALYAAYADSVDTESQAEQEQRMEEQDAAMKADKNTPKTAQVYIGTEENTGDAFVPYADPTSVEAVRDMAARHEEAERRAQEDRTFTESIPEDLKVASNDYTGEQIHKRMTKAASISDLESVVLDGMTSSNAQTREQTAESLNNLTSMLNSKNISMEEINSLKHSDADYIRAGYNGEEIGTFTNRQKQLYNIGQQQAIQARTENNIAQREEMTKNAGSVSTETAKTIYTGGYQTGMNASSYDRILKTMAAAGRNGMSVEEARSEVEADLAIVGGDQNTLNVTMTNAYNLAQEQSLADARYEMARAVVGQGSVQKFGSGVYLDSRSNKDVAINGTDALNAIAQITGLDVIVVDDGTKVGSSQGGFSVSEGAIYLNAGKAHRIGSTVFHETGEFASVFAPEEFQGFVKAANSFLLEKLGATKYNEIHEDYIKRYAKEKGKTDLDVDKEIACDLIYQIAGNKEGMTKLLDAVDANNSAQQAKSIKEKLIDWIKNIAKSIKDLFADFDPSSSQRKMADAKIAQMDEIVDMLNQSIAKAASNYQQAKENGVKNVVSETTSSQERSSLSEEDIENGKGPIERYGIQNGAAMRFSEATYEHGGREFLIDYLNRAEDLTQEQKDDIVARLDWAYKIMKDLSRSQFKYYSGWASTELTTDKVTGVPLVAMNAPGNKPIKSVAVNNGEYPLNIDFSQICKKRSTLNAVINSLVEDYGLNLPTLTESDINIINQTIKEHGYEIACGLCFVDAKRYRVGKWAESFTGEYDAPPKNAKKGWNDIVQLLRPVDMNSNTGFSYFNYATDIPNTTTAERTMDQLSEDEIDKSALEKMIGKFAVRDEDGNITDIAGYIQPSGKRRYLNEQIKMAWAIYSDPSMRHMLNKDDLISSDGLDAIREQNPALYTMVNSHWGAGKPKLPHGATAYGNEILRSSTWGSKNNFDPESARMVGGVRVQSFSDYEANMFFDYVQMFADMSARKLTSHAYTKETDYVRLFGMTGQKINMSVVARAADLTEDQQKHYQKFRSQGAMLKDSEFETIYETSGFNVKNIEEWAKNHPEADGLSIREAANLMAKDGVSIGEILLTEDESFSLDDALTLQRDERYADNCGIIWIGISDEQIRFMLDSDDVPMVIPYHSSGVSLYIKKARNLLLYKDYQNDQTTKGTNGRALAPAKEFDFYDSLYNRTNDPKATADEYLAWCKENGYTPKFKDFADHPNYYKLLIDFKVYDYNGVDADKVANRRYLPQQEVQMSFPEDTNQIVVDSLKRQQSTMDKLNADFADQNAGILSEISERLGLNDGSRMRMSEGEIETVEIEGNTFSLASDGASATDDAGNKYSVITLGKISNNDLKKRWKDVRSRIESELAKLYGKTITIKSDGTNVEIDEKFTRNYMWSPDSVNKGVTYRKNKMSALDGIELIVESASNPVWRKNEKPKHSKDAARGWRYYDAAWLINDKGNYSLYQGTLNVRMDINGKDYVYEVNNINEVAKQTNGLTTPAQTATSNQKIASEQEKVNLRYSLAEEDSSGKQLTSGQQEYFKDSKAVDEDGRLKVMYHGTEHAGFTVFDPSRSDDGTSLFFTDDPYIAGTYSDTQDVFDQEAGNGANANYEVYLNIKNPYVYDADYGYWDGIEETNEDDVKAAEGLSAILGNYSSDDAELYHIVQDTLDFGGQVTLSDEVEDFADKHHMSDTERVRALEFAARLDVSLDGYFAEGFDANVNYASAIARGVRLKTTRDIAAWAKGNGYDGVIFKNIVDEGPYSDNWAEMPSTVMVAFDSNQVKSVNNENPTADVDIRRSMDLEDNRNMNNEGISQNREEIAGILEKGAEALKGTKVNKQAIQNIAMEMKRQYSSAIDLDTFTDNLTKLFGYLHSGKSINYNDFVAVMQDVARPAIDAAYTSQASREDFAQFRNAIDGMEFSLSMEQRKAISGAFGSMKTFQRYYPEIHINSEAQSIQEQWSSLVDLFRGLLDENTEAADMPTALVDAMEALRPSMNTWSDNTQAAHDMALDIIAKYLGNYHDSGANKAVINEFTKTAQKQIKASQKEWKDKIKAEYNERLKVERAYQKELAAGRVARANERSAEQIAKLKAKNTTRIADIRERQKRNNQLRQINKSAGTLYQYLTSPSDQNHIPKDLQEPVLQLMASLDMSQPNIRQGEDGKWHTKILAGRTLDEASGRYAYEWQEITADTREDAIRQYNDALANGLGSAGARKWYDRMQDMADLYRKQKGGEVYADGNSQDMAEFIQGLDEELADEFDQILKDGRRDGKAFMADLDSEDLKVVNKVLRNVLHAVNGINRSYSMPSQTITEIAGEVMNKADRVNGRRNHNHNVEGTINFMMLSNATPETYMHGIGADKVTDIMIAAQNQKAWRIREANEYSENLFKGLKGDIRTWDKSQQYMGGKVTATKAQIMTLYELLKRPDAREHLLYGGFKVGAIGNKTNTQSRVIHLTEEQYNDLINEALTDKDKSVADGMQKFMAVNCSAWGNETSMALYGYDKFLDEKYWPMTVDKTSVETRTGEMMGGVANTIKNMGMTKATVSGANNALVINGALDVYAKHISDMAVYSSWAAPMQDMVRFFNYKEVAETEEGFVERRSTKEAIERMFGTGGTDYFKKLVASIQGSEQSSYEDPGFVTRMTSAAKKAAVLGNIRVMVQQPTAIFRAAKMIDNKYLIMGSAYKLAPYYHEAAELRNRSSATFWLKNQGNIDGQITQSFKSQVTGVQGFNDWFSEWTGKPAGFADEITWAAMYRAVYAEQVDKLGKDKIGTKEFEDAVNSRFDHIMLRTQVYDGTITRSQFMRSTDKMNQLQSAFMAEPVKTYNVILRDVIDWQQSKKGSQERKDATIALAKSTRVLLVTAAANAFMQSVWDAFRNAGDPDEEDEFWARVKAALLGWDGNLVDNIEPWNNIPVIGDYTETVIAGVQQIVSGKSQWTSSSDLSTSGISHLIDAGTAMVKYWRAMTDPEARDSNTQTAYGVLAKVVRAASDIFGIPAYAIQRDTVAIYNVLARNTLPFISGGAIDLPLLYKSKTSDKAQTKSDVYETIRTSTDLDEVRAAIDEAASHSNSYKSINSDMKEKLKDDLVAAYNRSPSEATQMINRIAEVKAYCSDKEGTLADKSHSKKVEYYKKQVKEWLE